MRISTWRSILGPRQRWTRRSSHLRRALDINPQNAEAHRNLGVALALQGRSARRWRNCAPRWTSGPIRPRRGRCSIVLQRSQAANR